METVSEASSEFEGVIAFATAHTFASAEVCRGVGCDLVISHGAVTQDLLVSTLYGACFFTFLLPFQAAFGYVSAPRLLDAGFVRISATDLEEAGALARIGTGFGSIFTAHLPSFTPDVLVHCLSFPSYFLLCSDRLRVFSGPHSALGGAVSDPRPYTPAPACNAVVLDLKSSDTRVSSVVFNVFCRHFRRFR